MLTIAETEENGQAGRRIGRASRCAFFSIMIFLAGCSNGGLLHGSKHKTDPLLGDPSKNSDKDGGPSRTSSNVPAIPPASASSNVALAMATPLPGARPLSIGENVNEPAAAKPATTLASTTTTPGDATLSRPPPVVVPLPRETPDVQPALITVAANQSNEYFLSQLRARGVTWHRADSVPGGIRFSCIVPNRQNPTITRTFEATAPDFPAAVNAVLQQIDRSN